MKFRVLLLFGMLIAFTSSCAIPSTATQTTQFLTSTTPEMPTSSPKTTDTRTIEGLYQTDVYGFTIPDGWGLTQSEGDHYDLNTKKNITIHNKSSAKGSVAFFTISSATMADGKTLQSYFDAAYQKGPAIENAVITPFERDTLIGIDITYGRPWGEPRWLLHDVWLENDQVVYVLTFQSYPNTFEEHADTFSSILDSFFFQKK